MSERKNVLILEFITTIGGVQTVYYNILPALCKRHRVFFLDPYRHPFDDQLRSVENLTVVDLPVDSVSALGWENGRKAKILLTYGLEYFRYFLTLRKFVRDHRIDLLYVSGKKEFVFAYLLNKTMNIPYIYHAHGFRSPMDISRLSRICINGARQVVAVSRSLRDCMIQAGVRGERIQVVHNGLNMERAREKTRDLPPSPKDAAFRIIFAGAIQPPKGVHTLLCAVNELMRERHDVRLKIFGKVIDENYYQSLLGLAAEVDKSRIEFCGFSDNIFEGISQCDVLVLPSEEESFGMVLLEAMYLSKPVIGSDIGGIGEVIEDDFNGLLFPSKNSRSLCERLAQLYDHPEQAQRLGRNGRGVLESKFSSEIQCNKILKIIGS